MQAKLISAAKVGDTFELAGKTMQNYMVTFEGDPIEYQVTSTNVTNYTYPIGHVLEYEVAELVSTGGRRNKAKVRKDLTREAQKNGGQAPQSQTQDPASQSPDPASAQNNAPSPTPSSSAKSNSVMSPFEKFSLRLKAFHLAMMLHESRGEAAIKEVPDIAETSKEIMKGINY